MFIKLSSLLLFNERVNKVVKRKEDWKYIERRTGRGGIRGQEYERKK